MTNDSLFKQIARFTKRARMAVGLLPRSGIGPASLPFRRAVPLGKDLSSRLEAMEIDIERLIRGWDQHIPQMLSTVAGARSDLREIARLEARLLHLEQMLLSPQAQVPGAGESPKPGHEPAPHVQTFDDNPQEGGATKARRNDV